MHVRSPRSFFKFALASLFVVGLASEAVAAGGKDKDAQKLLDSAMNDDYLATEFAKAEKKLKEAITKCGTDCSPEMMGKIHIALGTVHGVGLSKLDAAKDDFIAALKADPKAALDASLTTPELTKVFEEAKKAAGGSGGSGGKGGSDGDKPKKPPSESKAGHTPPSEQLVNTPVPVYFEPAADQAVKKASLRYKPFGAPKYKSIDMKPMGKGFGALIPCEEVTTTGDVKYYFVLTDESGDAAGTVGSADDPFKVPIKNEIEGAAPKLPGEKPPAQCKEKADCPPGLPGCPSGEKRGDKGWGASCEKNAECKEGYVCLNGTCEEGKGGDGGSGGGTTEEDKLNKSNMIGLWAQLDALIISGAEDVCNGTNASYVCFDKGTSNQFFGAPVTQKGTNGIQGGFGVGGARLMLSYDRKIHKVTKGLTVGARIGFAFGGSPSPENQPPNGSPIGVAKGFLPVHAEVRLSYHFLGSMFQRMKVSPYAFVGGGLAQVNASVPVQVCDAALRPGDKTGNGCPGNTTLREVDAYQITGLNFIGLGVGVNFAFHQYVGVAFELKGMIMLPTFGFVLAPTIGPVFGF